MSAWYVFATLGFYSVDPMRARYVRGIPLVDRATLRVPGRAPLHIVRIGRGDRLMHLTRDGLPLRAVTLRHAWLAAGGTLRFDTATSSGAQSIGR